MLRPYRVRWRPASRTKPRQSPRFRRAPSPAIRPRAGTVETYRIKTRLPAPCPSPTASLPVNTAPGGECVSCGTQNSANIFNSSAAALKLAPLANNGGSTQTMIFKVGKERNRTLPLSQDHLQRAAALGPISQFSKPNSASSFRRPRDGERTLRPTRTAAKERRLPFARAFVA